MSRPRSSATGRTKMNAKTASRLVDLLCILSCSLKYLSLISKVQGAFAAEIFQVDHLSGVHLRNIRDEVFINAEVRIEAA
jgi:hypothetical protein